VHMHISTINVPALIFDLIVYYLYNKLADEWHTSCDPCEDEKSNIQTKLHLHTTKEKICFLPIFWQCFNFIFSPMVPRETIGLLSVHQNYVATCKRKVVWVN
jgi:hypothetical protein